MPPGSAQRCYLDFLPPWVWEFPDYFFYFPDFFLVLSVSEADFAPDTFVPREQQKPDARAVESHEVEKAGARPWKVSEPPISKSTNPKH